MSQTAESAYYQSIRTNAFRQDEYSPKTPALAIRNHVESYLGEYRFRLQKYDYELVHPSIDGHLKGIHESESLFQQNIKAIARREREGKSTYREEAELQGIIAVEELIEASRPGDQIVWASPPGNIEDGYENYGFVFVGTVGETIEMSAYSVESPTFEKFNQFLTVTTGSEIERSSEAEFLSSPQRLPVPVSLETIEANLKDIFQSERDLLKEDVFKRVMKSISPHIDHYISLIELGASPDFLQEVFNSLENFAIKLQTVYTTELNGTISIDRNVVHYSFDQIVSRFNFTPPAVGGSCGSSGGKKELSTSNILNKFSLNSSLSSSEEKFVCPNCHQKAEGPVGDKCPNPACGITKEQWAKKGGQVC